MRTKNFNGAAVLLGAAFVLFAVSPVAAHARLVSANPKADAVVAAPHTLLLQFDDELAPKLSGVELSKDGAKIALAPVTFDAKNKAMTITPQAPFAPGLYKVTWHAVATEDLHKTEGAFSFTVK